MLPHTTYWSTLYHNIQTSEQVIVGKSISLRDNTRESPKTRHQSDYDDTKKLRHQKLYLLKQW